ncbi:MAG TPA: tetratricopeptide repeat protein [Polyangium sp.]|nr:tetratricopeptide repeat protein [Polyangium sp.]
MNEKERRESTVGNVIHVVFGRGGGRVPEPPRPPAPVNDAYPVESLEPPPVPREPATDVYTSAEVCRLLGLTAARLRSLSKAGIVPPTGRHKGRPAYTFSDLIALRAARDLLAKKVRLRDVAKAIENIRVTLPKVTRPLAELRIVSDGQGGVVVKSAAGNFEPITGQMLIDFDVKALRDDVVRVLRPMVGRDRAKTAYDHYVRGTQLDENPATMNDAEALYRRAIEIDPWLAIAYTNLGNICFRRGNVDEAEELYRRALEIDQRQPEAQYNLGYVMLEYGHSYEAVSFFRGAIESDPRFADAYFNLAMAYEQAGDRAKALPCWRKYLEIEPTGTWAEIARKHL